MLALFVFLSIQSTFLFTPPIQQINKTEEVSWLLSYNKAKQKAVESNHPILMVFSGSDWCRPCILLTTELFDSDEFKDFASENLVLLKLDFPASKKNQLSPEQKKHNEELAEKYNPKGSFPLAVVVDQEGNVLGSFGYTPGNLPSEYIHQIQSISTHAN